MLKVQIHDDEILTSFLSRSAWVNGIERMRSFCVDLGVDLSKIKLGDRDEVTRLAGILSVSPHRLMQAAVERNDGTRVRVGHEWFDNSRLDRKHLRFCPDCIVADAVRDPSSGPYYRSYWLLPQIVTCIEHKKQIVEAKQPQRLETNSQDFCAIIDQVRKQAPVLLDEGTSRDPSHFEMYATKRLRNELYENPHFEGLPLETIVVMSEIVGVAVAHPGASKRILSTEQMVQARELGFASIYKGLHGFLESLDKVAAFAPAGCCSPQGLYGALYNSLDRTRSQGSYDVFRSALAEHAAMSGRIAPGTSLFGALTKSHASRARSIASEAGVAIDRVKRVLKSRGLTAPAGAAGLLDPSVAAAARDHFADVWSFKVARDVLGCNLRTFNSLLAAGIIAPPPASFPQGYVSRSEVKALVARLTDNRSADDGSHLVDIHAARAGADSSIAEIIQYVLDGKLRSVKVKADLPALTSLRVSIEEIRQAHLPAGHVTADVARDLMRLNTTGFAGLLRNGILRTTPLGHPREGWHAVPVAEIERFKATHISMQECAEELAVSKNAMASLARRAKFRSVYPPEIVGQKIFFRSEFASFCRENRVSELKCVPAWEN